VWFGQRLDGGGRPSPLEFYAGLFQQLGVRAIAGFAGAFFSKYLFIRVPQAFSARFVCFVGPVKARRRIIEEGNVSRVLESWARRRTAESDSVVPVRRSKMCLQTLEPFAEGDGDIAAVSKGLFEGGGTKNLRSEAKRTEPSVLSWLSGRSRAGERLRSLSTSGRLTGNATGYVVGALMRGSFSEDLVGSCAFIC